MVEFEFVLRYRFGLKSQSRPPLTAADIDMLNTTRTIKEVISDWLTAMIDKQMITLIGNLSHVRP